MVRNLFAGIVLSVLLVPLLLTTPACGKVATPAQAAKQGTTLTESVRKVQQWTTGQVRAGVLPRPAGDKITDTNAEVLKLGEAVLAGLDAWNAAASGELRQAEAARVFALLSRFEAKVAELTGVALPSFTLSRELSQLTSNVLKDVEAIKAALRSS